MFQRVPQVQVARARFRTGKRLRMIDHDEPPEITQALLVISVIVARTPRNRNISFGCRLALSPDFYGWNVSTTLFLMCVHHYTTPFPFPEGLRGNRITCRCYVRQACYYVTVCTPRGFSIHHFIARPPAKRIIRPS